MNDSVKYFDSLTQPASVEITEQDFLKLQQEILASVKFGYSQWSIPESDFPNDYELWRLLANNDRQTLLKPILDRLIAIGESRELFLRERLFVNEAASRAKRLTDLFFRN